VDRRRALKGKFAHVQQPFRRFQKMLSGGRQLCSCASTPEQLCFYALFQLLDLGTE